MSIYFNNLCLHPRQVNQRRITVLTFGEEVFRIVLDIVCTPVQPSNDVCFHRLHTHVLECQLSNKFIPNAAHQIMFPE